MLKSALDILLRCFCSLAPTVSNLFQRKPVCVGKYDVRVWYDPKQAQESAPLLIFIAQMSGQLSSYGGFPWFAGILLWWADKTPFWLLNDTLCSVIWCYGVIWPQASSRMGPTSDIYCHYVRATQRLRWLPLLRRGTPLVSLIRPLLTAPMCTYEI